LARIEELERRLRRNSQNSSKPPSSDGPEAPVQPRKDPEPGEKKRKPGGQPGHEGHHRPLLPAEQVDGFEDHYPVQCGGCRRRLPSRERHLVGEPARHQVTDVPPVEPTTLEHRCHHQQCPDCGTVTSAVLPADVPRSWFGPRLTALVAILSGGYRLSKRSIVEIVHDLFGVEMSLGSVTACEQAVSMAVEAPVAEAHDFVQRQPVANADETSWRERLQKAWLWVMATPAVTVFKIHRRRGAVAAKALLGTFRGILTTDRWDGYLWYRGLRQICWAHLLRDFQDMSERKGQAGNIGRQLLGNTKRVFKHWHRVRDGTMTRLGFRRSMTNLRLDFERLLELGQRGRTSIAGMCEEMLKLFPSFFTFVDHEGVEPTNNFGERQIRFAVIWRKTSFGTHSEQGSRFVERLLTVRASLRQQNRSVVEFLVQAYDAALRGEPAPSLLPRIHDENHAFASIAA